MNLGDKLFVLIGCMLVTWGMVLALGVPGALIGSGASMVVLGALGALFKH